jgi:hypothetical protein
MFPVKYLTPILNLLKLLVKNYGCTVLLMSATNPPFQRLLGGETEIHEIVADKTELYNALKRVQIEKLGDKTDDEIIKCVEAESGSTLVIVNTRRRAKTLFELYNGGSNGNAYHLSTLMTPKARGETIGEIRGKLERGEKCAVFSTQLIECGVDLDFETVYRSMAGLDSIVQAAGRCNRNGTRAVGKVKVFGAKGEAGAAKGDIALRAGITRPILEKSADLLSPDAIGEYFDELFTFAGDSGLDGGRIMNMFEIRPAAGRNRLAFEFETCAANFKLIDDNSVSVIIPTDDAAKGCVAQAGKFHKRQILRKLQKYTVGIYEREAARLLSDGALTPLGERLFVLTDLTRYDKKLGLALEAKEMSEAIFDS